MKTEGEDGWCRHCNKGLETGLTICRECMFLYCKRNNVDDNHFWMLKELTSEGEIFYCQKCLMEICVTRYINSVEVNILSNDNFEVMDG
jgi:hypothetical protein